MYELSRNALAVTAGVAVGVGGAVVVSEIGFEEAFAGSNTSNPEHVRTAAVKLTLPKYGGKLVLSSEGTLSPKLDVPTVSAEAASSTPQPGDAGYKAYVKRRIKRINNTCRYSVSLAPLGSTKIYSSNKRKITGNYKIPQSGNTVYSYTLKGGAEHCDSYGQTRDGTIVFPKVLKRRHSGKTTDKAGINQPKGLSGVVFFAK